jgi:hypothetical protein
LFSLSLTNGLVLLKASRLPFSSNLTVKPHLCPYTLDDRRPLAMRLAPLLLSMVAVSSAAPSNFFNHAYDFSDELAEFYGKVSKYIDNVRHNVTPSSTCDTSKISLPSFASSLPSPDGVTSMYVALGRGTQVCTH